MSSRSATGWSEWEEKNLLPWLDEHRALPWKARSNAYFAQYQIYRSVESLRGKKYHILRKRRLARARLSKDKDQVNPTRPGRRVRRQMAAARGSLAALPSKKTVQRNIGQWLQGIPPTQSSHTESSHSTQSKSTKSGLKRRTIHRSLLANPHHSPCDARGQSLSA